MTTVINSPGNGSDGVGAGMIGGVLIVIVAIVLFFVYGLPAIRANKGEPKTTNINVQVPNPVTPEPTSGTTTE